MGFFEIFRIASFLIILIILIILLLTFADGMDFAIVLCRQPGLAQSPFSRSWRAVEPRLRQGWHPFRRHWRGC